MKSFSLLTAFAIGTIAFTSSCKKENLTPEVTSPDNTFSIPLQLDYQPSVRLGVTHGFAVLASTSVTNDGYTAVNGNLGITAGEIFLGFPKDAVHGNLEINSESSANTQADLLKAYSDVASRQTSDMVTLSGNIGSLTLTPGLYTSSAVDISSGDLVLDARGDETAVFVIKVANNFNTAANTKVILQNNAKAENVFWQVGGVVSLGSSSIFNGTLFANQSVIVENGAVINGRIFSVNGSVEFDSNTITRP